jgi:chemotaxis protein CheX
MVETIAEVVKSVWLAVFGAGLEQAEGNEELWSAENPVTACVQISGAWEGVVSARFSGQLAREVTAAMFDMPADATSSSEVSDALGEVVNIIGGRFKANLPGDSKLSLPWVTAGSAHSVQFPNCQVEQRVLMRAPGGLVAVSVMAVDRSDSGLHNTRRALHHK